MRPQTLRWHDWSGSVLLHTALLLSVMWGLAQSAVVVPKPVSLDLRVSWEPVATPELTPPPPPPPPQRQMLRVPPVPTPQPQAVPTPVSPVLSTPLQAADTLVAPAVVATKPALPANVATPPAATTVVPTASALAAQEQRWHSVLEAALLKNKHYPMVARRMRQEGVVTVDAQFSASGELLHCAVAAGSGFTALDEAALHLVRQAAELVRTTHQPGRVARLRIPVVYELKET